MYVSSLDRPWTETPFPLQGFLIQSPEQMIALKRFCQFVFIDVKKSNFDDDVTLKKLLGISGGKNARDQKAQIAREELSLSTQNLDVDHSKYPRNPLTRKEVVHAEKAYEGVERALKDIYVQLNNGSSLDPKQIEQAANMMVDSVVQCPNSFQWLLKIRKHQSRLFDHALRSSCWALVCARHVGLDEMNLRALALGILLKDIGRVELKKLKETDPEAASSKNFVELGTRFLRDNNVSAKVISVVKYHCEKHDGTGQPYGVAGSRIPILARFAGIATFYDRVVFGVRKGDKPVPPSQAARMLYEQRDQAFQEELVVEFIEAIGLYPMGTMVELNTGEMAIVAEQDPMRRLKPKVIVVKNPNGSPARDLRYVDLDRSHNDKLETMRSAHLVALEERATKVVTDHALTDNVLNFELVRDAFLREHKKKPNVPVKPTLIGRITSALTG